MASGAESQIIALMRMTAPQLRMAWWRGRIAQWLGVALAWVWLGFIVFLVRYGSLLPSTSLPTDQQDFIMVVMALVILPLGTILFTIIVAPPQTRWFGSRVLRSAALAGNDTIAPLMIDQPAPLASDELPHDMTRLLRLKFPTVSRWAIILSWAAVIMAVGITILNLTFLQQPSQPYELRVVNDLFQYVYSLFIVEKIIALYGGPEVVAHGWGVFLPMRRQRLLAIDDWGIRWRARGWRTRELTLAWHDVTAFCAHRRRSESGSNSSYTYALMGSEQSFAWIVSARAKESERAASELLVRLVIARTGCPLRDVTGSADILDGWSRYLGRGPDLRPKPNEQEPRKTLLAELALAQSYDDGRMSPMGFGQTMPGPIRLRARVYWINALLILLVVAGLCGGWWFNQHQMADYYQALPARITAQAPLYSDSLTSDSHAWPVQAPSAADPANLAYANGGYTINGGLQHSDYNVWRGARYADLAVAVTVRQFATPEDGPVGIVARVLTSGVGAADEVIFEISPSSGAWDLVHYQPEQGLPDGGWDYLVAGEQNAAIHTGDGATNRLMLVVTGATYLAYVNGQLLGSVEDPYAAESPSQTGYPGLYVLSSSTTGVFNDFAIYPAPPPYQPLLHGLGL